jgi:hypothetical protein
LETLERQSVRKVAEMQTKTRTGRDESACLADSGIWSSSRLRAERELAPISRRPIDVRNVVEWCVVVLLLLGLLLVGMAGLELITRQLLELAEPGVRPWHE